MTSLDGFTSTFCDKLALLANEQGSIKFPTDYLIHEHLFFHINGGYAEYKLPHPVWSDWMRKEVT